ncbi:hypothetical protein [Wolbachia endosymbiont of Pentidionis agamae]
MKSKNSYPGIDSKVVGLVKFFANYYKSLKCSTDQSIEDIEQDLFCEFF